MAAFTIETSVSEERTLIASYQSGTQNLIQLQSLFAHSSLTSDKGPPPQEETETYISTPRGLLVPVIFRYFFPFARNSRHVSQILTEGTRRAPHPSSSLLRRHLKTAEDPHINRSFTRTQDLPDTWQ